jgi:hypothetical protein
MLNNGKAPSDFSMTAMIKEPLVALEEAVL